MVIYRVTSFIDHSFIVTYSTLEKIHVQITNLGRWSSSRRSWCLWSKSTSATIAPTSLPWQPQQPRPEWQPSRRRSPWPACSANLQIFFVWDNRPSDLTHDKQSDVYRFHFLLQISIILFTICHKSWLTCFFVKHKFYPWRCLCLGLEQITITFLFRLIKRQLSQIFLTDARIFIIFLFVCNK